MLDRLCIRLLIDYSFLWKYILIKNKPNRKYLMN